MCGIAGFVGSGGSKDVLRPMADALRQRGPDDEGFYIQDGLGFAFRRLSIVDIQGGHQPMTNHDESVVVMMNGEIYGYRELRRELEARGCVFRTSSDTETIIHAYAEWGEHCFERLNGMFAIALWDRNKRTLFLARDRMGKKPLYWMQQGETLWFASEPKAFLSAGVLRRELDPVSLALYFQTDSVPTPRSIFKDLHVLAPATVLRFQEGRVRDMRMFWQLPSGPESMSSEEAVALFHDAFDAAVKDRLISDVPLGLFLSGGLDSAAVAASAARQSSAPLKAFTIGFEDASYDERDAARAVAERLGLDHYTETLSSDAALAMLDEAVHCLDEPLADAAILPQLLLARFARKRVTVAVAGDGGDELLLGYQHVPAHFFAESHPGIWGLLAPFRHTPNLLPATRGYFSSGFKLQRLARGFGIRNPWERDLAWRGSWTRDAASQLLSPDVRAAAFMESAGALLAERARELGPDRSFTDQWSWVYIRSYLLDDILVKVDRATMWMSLEARAPLLDYRCVEAAFRIPDAYKTGDWSGKRLLKEPLRATLPASLLDRPKHGFGVPVASWLNGPLSSELRSYADPVFLKKQGLFQPEMVERVIKEHSVGRPDRRKELWSYFMFQRWYRTWLSPSA